jgi:hypothetical protein
MLVDVVEGNVIDTSCCTCGGSSSVFQASTEITFLEESHPAITEVPSTGTFLLRLAYTNIILNITFFNEKTHSDMLYGTTVPGKFHSACFRSKKRTVWFLKDPFSTDLFVMTQNVGSPRLGISQIRLSQNVNFTACNRFFGEGGCTAVDCMSHSRFVPHRPFRGKLNIVPSNRSY